MIIVRDFSTTEEPFHADISTFPKNHKDETVYRILLKDFYVPMLSL